MNDKTAQWLKEAKEEEKAKNIANGQEFVEKFKLKKIFIASICLFFLWIFFDGIINEVKNKDNVAKYRHSQYIKKTNEMIKDKAKR